MLPLVGALHSPKLEQKMSTILSFDLRRKTKHHRQRNSSTTITPTPAPKTDGNQEEMEFTLRVCLFNLTKLRVHTNVKRKQIHCFMQVFNAAVLVNKSMENNIFTSSHGVLILFCLIYTEYIVCLCY